VLELFRLPERVQGYANALRASERFLWPFAYALLLAAVVAMIRGFGARRAGLALSVLVVVQWLDMGRASRGLDHYFPRRSRGRAAPPPGPLLGRGRAPPRPRAAGAHRHAGPPLEEIAVYAATHRLPTDAVYLARLDPAKVEALNAATLTRCARAATSPAASTRWAPRRRSRQREQATTPRGT
jgi:hypothetical protein